jgi:hypothetical protein
MSRAGAKAAGALVKVLAAVMTIVAFMYLLAALGAYFGAVANRGPVESAIAAIAAHTPAMPGLPNPSTPFGGLCRLDFLLVATVLLVSEWFVAKAGDRLWYGRDGARRGGGGGASSRDDARYARRTSSDGVAAGDGGYWDDRSTWDDRAAWEDGAWDGRDVSGWNGAGWSDGYRRDNAGDHLGDTGSLRRK